VASYYFFTGISLNLISAIMSEYPRAAEVHVVKVLTSVTVKRVVYRNLSWA
jgi:hypothetical protein